MNKALEAFRTISEVAGDLDVPKHVLRFWEVKFPQIRPMKRGGGRRYYRPEDLVLLRGIQHLLHAEGYTIKGVQKILREQGVEQVKVAGGKAVDALEGRTKAPAAKAAVPETGRVRVLPKAIRGNEGVAQAQRAAVEAAIDELKACRALLTGAVVKAASAAAPRTRGARPARSTR